MNRMLTATKDWGHEVVAGWNRFWFTPTDPATYCLIRILAGAMLLYTHLVWTIDLPGFFGKHAWLSPEVAELLYHEGNYRWSHFLLSESALWLWGTHLVALAVFAMLTLGLFSRVVSVLAFLFTVSYIHRTPGAVFGLDQINTFLAMYLMVGPCGACYSLDRWLKRRRAGGEPPPVEPSVAANIGIRLLQLHMCVIYFFAGTAKLQGAAWWDGWAMWMAFANLEYQSLDMTWMADWPILMNLMTHVTVYWELTYFALVWPRLTRPVVLVLAVPLHLGIALCLGMITFGLIMIVGNMAFLPPWVVRAAVDRLPWPGQGRGEGGAERKGEGGRRKGEGTGRKAQGGGRKREEMAGSPARSARARK